MIQKSIKIDQETQDFTLQMSWHIFFTAEGRYYMKNAEGWNRKNTKQHVDESKKEAGGDLTFYEHGHVHEHVVKFFDRLLQLHNVIVSRFNVLQWLLRLLRIGDDLTR